MEVDEGDVETDYFFDVVDTEVVEACCALEVHVRFVLWRRGSDCLQRDHPVVTLDALTTWSGVATSWKVDVNWNGKLGRFLTGIFEKSTLL